MSRLLDTSKPYRQRDGRRARFLGEIADADYPLVFAYEREGGREAVMNVSRYGLYLNGESNDQDIVNIEAADG
jgi:hypothetical protein